MEWFEQEEPVEPHSSKEAFNARVSKYNDSLKSHFKESNIP